MARLPEWAERVAEGRVTPAVRNAILGMGETARGTLLRIATSAAHRTGPPEGPSPGPRAAIGLLAEMPYDDETARSFVQSLLVAPTDEEAPDLADALCEFGTTPVPHLVDGLRAADTPLGTEWMADLLVHIAAGDDRVLPALLDALPRFPGEVAVALGRLGDPHAILPLRGVFAAHRVGGGPDGLADLDAVAVATAIEILGGELTVAERRKRDDAERRGRRVVLRSLDRAREALRTGEAALRALVDPGPNDPCPCGSGRKFKKCHEGDATFRRATDLALGARDGDATP